MVAKRGQKKVHYRQSGKKEQISVIGCDNAVGQSIPPMVIFEGKYLNLQWTVGEVPGTYYAMSDKGWTQDSQPLDCTVFGPLKHHWSAICHEFQQKHPGMVISKLNFTELFAKAWLQALTPANIVAGVCSCGIYPFSRNGISFPDDGDSGSSGANLRNPSSHNATDGDHSVVASTLNTFTSKQIELFQTRFEEGCNIYNDKDYVAWLELNHPEAAPSNQTYSNIFA